MTRYFNPTTRRVISLDQDSLGPIEISQLEENEGYIQLEADLILPRGDFTLKEGSKALAELRRRIDRYSTDVEGSLPAAGPKKPRRRGGKK